MKTKIVATIGPASSSPEILAGLINAGVRIFRLNFSHGDSSAFVGLIDTIRSLERELAVPITIMQDLSGPKIRIGILPGEGALPLQEGDHLLLGPEAHRAMAGERHPGFPYVPFDHQAILSQLEAGDRLVLADGSLQFKVAEALPDQLFLLEAQNSGLITSRKGLALPGKSVRVPALTEKDKKDLADGLRLGVDAVAISYVQSPEDIQEARAIIREHGRDIPIVAKLERRNAVDRLNAILQETDIVMVARGDLGVECPLPELPAMQKRIIRACNQAAKPVIVATQMLLSMVSNPAPTRAETTDVANAVLDGADCVMLSEETAMGAYPVETVRVMGEIVTQAETLLTETAHLSAPDAEKDTAAFLAYAACLLADKAPARAIVAHSNSGASARVLAARRPAQPVHALTPNPGTVKTLNFSWGVQPHQVDNDGEGHLLRAERFINESASFAPGDALVITAGQPTLSSPSSGSTNLVKMYCK